MKKRYRFEAVGFLWLALLLLPQGAAAEGATLSGPKLEMRVQLLNEIYRMNRPLPVHVEVINRDNRPVTLYLGNNLLHNFRFRVRTLQNVTVKDRIAYQLKLEDSRNQPVKTRTMVLQPGEKYGRVVNLTPRKLLVKPDRYQVTGYFYLRPQRTDADRKFISNSLRFSLKPPAAVDSVVVAKRRQRLQALDRRLTAGETVDFMIRAKRRRDWKNYFRFMDLKQLVKFFHNFSGKYADAVFSKKPAVLNDFKEFLKKFPAEQITRHFVQQVTITRDEQTLDETAKVQCLIVYRDGRLLEKKIYHFSLYRQLDRWYVSGYYVVNRN